MKHTKALLLLGPLLLLILVGGVCAVLFGNTFKARLYSLEFASCLDQGKLQSYDSNSDSNFFREMDTCETGPYDEKITSSDIDSYFKSTVSNVTSKSGQRPRFYLREGDGERWEHVIAVWQLKEHFLTVSAGMGNDSDWIIWKACRGQFDPSHGVFSSKEVPETGYVLPLRK